jgi:hypothetical protein
MTAGAVEPEAIEFAPLTAEANFDTAFDAVSPIFLKWLSRDFDDQNC